MYLIFIIHSFVDGHLGCILYQAFIFGSPTSSQIMTQRLLNALPILGSFLAISFKLSGVRELSVFCQSYFNKTLIGQAGSIGRKARQEVGVEKRDWEYSGKQEASTPAQTTEEAACNLPRWKRYQAIWLT